MESREIEPFIESLAAHEPSEKRSEDLKAIDNLETDAAGLRGILQVMESDGWQAFLDSRVKADNALARSIIHGKELDPFLTGKAFGRIEFVLEMRSAKDRIKQRLERTAKDIEFLRNKAKQEAHS